MGVGLSPSPGSAERRPKPLKMLGSQNRGRGGVVVLGDGGTAVSSPSCCPSPGPRFELPLKVKPNQGASPPYGHGSTLCSGKAGEFRKFSRGGVEATGIDCLIFGSPGPGGGWRRGSSGAGGGRNARRFWRSAPGKGMELDG